MKMKNYLVYVLFLTCLVLNSAMGFSQGRKVTGKVTDASTGDPIPGVTVVIENTTTGTVTNLEGNYTINVPGENRALLISAMGYLNQRIPVAGRTVIDVSLVLDVKALDEVVVIGYGTQDARKVSSAISSVSSEDINKIQTSSLEMALQGRSSGMQVSATSGEPGSTVRIRIRGTNSIAGDNSPLIVLDGYPLFDVQAPTGGLDQANNSLLSFLNPDDIESVQVLKDAAATAIYGARGANGVLMITTKQGQTGRTKVSFTVESIFNEKAEYPEMMTGPQYIDFGNEFSARDSVAPNPDTITTSWIDLIQQPAWGQNYSLSFSGGNQVTRYLISGSFSDFKGVMLGSGFKRGTARANLTSKLGDKFTVTTNLNYTQTFNDRVAGSNGTAGGGVIFNALKVSPLIPEDRAEEDPFANEYVTTPTNPLLQIKGQTDRQDQKVILANVAADYQLFKDLKLTLRGGTNVNISNRERYWDRRTGLGYQRGSRAQLLNSWNTNYLMEAYATYNKVFGSHSITAVGGYSYQFNYTKNVTNVVESIPTDALGAYGIGFGTNISSIPYTRTDRTLQSFFGRANYSFDERYLLALSGRLDGSSVFTDDQKYAFFPSVSAAWRINEESFMENVEFISELKLRGGYGLTGNQAIRPYESIPQFGEGNSVSGNTVVPGVRPLVIGNPFLRWETTEQINAGLDIQVLNGRLGLNVDYYIKTTKDLLLPFQLPSSAGYQSITTNRGSLENKGLEITISGTPVVTQNFSWRTNINWSQNESKVLDLGGLDFIPGPKLDNNFIKENISGQWVGQPFSMYYGYIVGGLIQPEYKDEEGNILDNPETGEPYFVPYEGVKADGRWFFKDVNGDGIISPDDRVFLGDPNPDFFFGWNNDFSYKNFTLNVFLQGSYGGKIFNAGKIYTGLGYTPYNNTRDWYENRWTPENPHDDPLYPSATGVNFGKPNNLTVEDGSYVRLKNVSLRYTIPMKSVTFIKSLEIYTTATNLLTFTNYSGMDPEVNLFGNRDDAIGVDFFAYPQVRTYTFGIKLGL